MAKSPGKQFNISEELNKSEVTPEFRVSYEHMITPWTGDPAKPARYSVQMVFDKKKDAAWLKETKQKIAKIAVEAFGENAVALIKRGRLHQPFRDGDDEFPDDPNYAGKVFANANGSIEGKRAPELLDPTLKRNIRDMADPEDYFYSGCYAKAEIKFFPFDREGGKGIACFIFRAQKRRDGERLGGGRPATEVFDAVEEEASDDWDNEEEEVKTPTRRSRRRRTVEENIDF